MTLWKDTEKIICKRREKEQTMSRYIDADRLIDELNRRGIEYRADIDDVIRTTPTADVEQVVRCKDCKWYDPPSIEVPTWTPCSERLPKKERATYLICTERGYMCLCRWTNDMYGLGSNEWSEWGWHIMDKPQYAKVVAWMEMELWKGADDE